MKITVAIRSTATLLFFALYLTAQAETVSVIGPLEAVSPNGGAITVLGQTYKTDTKGFFRDSSQKSGPADASLLPPVGTFVAVQGQRSSEGDQVATSIRALRSRYVPGVSNIYLRGVAASYDATVAVAELGILRVYLGDINGETLVGLSQGAMIEIVGSQAQPGGLVWATAVWIVRPPAEVSDERASGKGASTRSVTRTGVSAQSITGTGLGVQSVTGAGASTQSVTGTGVSAQSITGTGAGIQSVTGTETSTQSVTGTGVSAQSITGTGVSIQSVTGTGASI